MGTFKRQITLGLVFAFTVLFALPAGANIKAIKDKNRRKPAGVLQRELRLAHAQELLGKHYPKSSVRSGEKIKKINAHIYEWTKESLPKKYRKKHEKIAQMIIDQSLKYEMDPVFLVSVILGESSFNPSMRGKLDEIGLMQIRPATGEWIAKMHDIPWKGEKTLLDPVQNIRIGTVYLHYLRTKFDSHAQLYLAAYNMGPRNVNNAVEQNIWPKDYPSHVMKYYVDFYTRLDGELKTKTRTKKSIAATEQSQQSASPGT